VGMGQGYSPAETIARIGRGRHGVVAGVCELRLIHIVYGKYNLYFS